MINRTRTDRAWRIVAVMDDETERVLNPQQLFIGDFVEVAEEADRLTEEMDGVESIIYESRGQVG